MLGCYYCLYFLEFSYYIPPNCTFGIELKELRDKFWLEKTFLRSLILSSGTGNKLTDSGLRVQKMGLKKIMQIFIQEKKIISFVGEIHFPQTITKPKRIFVFWLTLNRYPEKTPPWMYQHITHSKTKIRPPKLAATSRKIINFVLAIMQEFISHTFIWQMRVVECAILLQ